MGEVAVVGQRDNGHTQAVADPAHDVAVEVPVQNAPDEGIAGARTVYDDGWRHRYVSVASRSVVAHASSAVGAHYVGRAGHPGERSGDLGAFPGHAEHLLGVRA